MNDRFHVYRNPTPYEASAGTTQADLDAWENRATPRSREGAAAEARIMRAQGGTGIRIVPVRESARARAHPRRIRSNLYEDSPEVARLREREQDREFSLERKDRISRGEHA